MVMLRVKGKEGPFCEIEIDQSRKVLRAKAQTPIQLTRMRDRDQRTVLGQKNRQSVLTGAKEQRSGDITETEGHRNLLSENIERIIFLLRKCIEYTMTG